MAPVDPERWSKVRAVLESAIEMNAEERRAFLDERCADDSALRAEVESLIANHESAGEFIERPVYEVVPELLEEAPTDSLAGRRLGPYAVTEELGRGGMGVVYLAEDTRLGRKVALKALAPQFTSGEQHRERLRREARAVAALSHPGVATVFSLEELDGILCIVSEYVRGETLRAELARGPLPTKTLLDTAFELADILAAAHAGGVIHRDLKPENAIRSAEGRIKILDFGLARIQSLGGEPAPKKITRAGSFMGTPAYASPEQLRGMDVDARTDIFSLGVVLYELASGIHPFGGRDSISTIARILEKEPVELTRLSPLSPPALDRIIRKCLSKKPDGRYANARELAGDLEQLRRDEAHVTPHPEAMQEGPGSAPPEALWWWQFHQVVIALAGYLLLYPLWKVREWIGGIPGSSLFFAALIAVGIAANLRLHLCFTSKHYASELAAQMRKVASWLRWSEAMFVALLAAAAAAISGIHAFWAALILGAAIAFVVSMLAIEPATSRAAFGKEMQERR